MTRRFAASVCVSAALLGACASRPAVRLPQADFGTTAALSRADDLVRAGCYTCLREAVGIYEQVAAAAGPGADARRRVVDTYLLMALRERELGIGRGTSLDRARNAASQLPAPWDFNVFVSLVEAHGWRAGSVASEVRDASLETMRATNRSWQAWRAALEGAAASDLPSQYHLLSFDCLNQHRLQAAGMQPWQPERGAPPLLEYRLATCGGDDRPRLEALAKQVPNFAELHLVLGELALAAGTLRTAERHLTTAVTAIPELTPARLALGHVFFTMEEFDLAHDAYHSVVADVPGHREAMLGEAKTLSYLARHADAIVILDRMVELGTWYMGEAHYWRGWNKYRLKQFDAADDDVAAARSRLPMDPQVDKLAGMVALARHEVERAEREFRLAVEHVEGRGGRDCDASYYLGSVLVMQRKWPEGGPVFEAAVPCYVLDENAVRSRLAEIRRSDLPDDRKERLLASKERDIVAVRAQQARAAFNGAVAYVNNGQPGKAKPLAQRAASSPDLAEQVQALLERIR